MRRAGHPLETHVLPEATSEADLLALLARLNSDPRLHGILVQAPLPAHIRRDGRLCHRAPAEGCGRVPSGERGQADAGRSDRLSALHAGGHPRAAGARRACRSAGAEVVVLGRGNIVGKPMAAMLCQKEKHANATVTICHSATRDIRSHCRRADILIAAMGVPEFVKADMVKPGAVVMDVGVNRVPDPTAKGGLALVGDVDFAEVQPVAGRITPNPGGVGPMTIAMLMQNTVPAAEGGCRLNPKPASPMPRTSYRCNHPHSARPAVLVALRGNPPGGQRKLLPDRRHQFHPRAATAGGGVQAEPLQPLDGGRGPVRGDRAAHRAGPDHGAAERRGEVRVAGRRCTRPLSRVRPGRVQDAPASTTLKCWWMT